MSDTVMFERIAVVGVGLLGGSIGLAAHEKKLCSEVVGIGRKQPGLDEALRLEAINRGTTDMEAGVADADLVVLCTPVRHILSVLPSVMKVMKPGAILTDVGSTKLSIVTTGDDSVVEGGALFVGSHPMAGSEKSGVRFSRSDLYANTTCFVTKTPATNLDAFARVANFWRALGSRVVIVRPDRHDRLVALISHLPHLMAVALMRMIDNCHEDKNLIKGIIGNGFRDTTRIAAGSTDMWEDICLDNDQEIRGARDEFLRAADEIVSLCGSSSPEVRQLLDSVSEYRRFLDCK